MGGGLGDVHGGRRLNIYRSICSMVSSNTRSGDRKRLPKMGYAGSDLDIEFTLDEPESLTAVQIEALESLKNAGL